VTVSDAASLRNALTVDNAVIDLQADIVISEQRVSAGTGYGILFVNGGITATIFSSTGRKVVSGQREFPCFHVADSTLFIYDLTVTNCKGWGGGAGAFYIAQDSRTSVTAHGLHVKSNIATPSSTAGVGVFGAAFSCIGCVFEDNIAERAASAFAVTGELSLEGALFTGNRATDERGSFYGNNYFKASFNNVHFAAGEELHFSNHGSSYVTMTCPAGTAPFPAGCCYAEGFEDAADNCELSGVQSALAQYAFDSEMLRNSV